MAAHRGTVVRLGSSQGFVEMLSPWCLIVSKKRRDRSPALSLPFDDLVGTNGADLCSIAPKGDVAASSDVSDVAHGDLHLLAGVRTEDHEAHGHGLIGLQEGVRKSDEAVGCVLSRGDELGDTLHGDRLNLETHVRAGVGSAVSNTEDEPLASLESASAKSAECKGRLCSGSYCSRAKGKDLEATLRAREGSGAASGHSSVSRKIIKGGSAISVSHLFCSKVSVV